MLRAAFTSRPHGIKRVALARAVAIAIPVGREGGNNAHRTGPAAQSLRDGKRAPPLHVRDSSNRARILQLNSGAFYGVVSRRTISLN
jgi:hypothetical protein